MKPSLIPKKHTAEMQALQEKQAKEVILHIEHYLKELQRAQPTIKGVEYSMGVWWFSGIAKGYYLDNSGEAKTEELQTYISEVCSDNPGILNKLWVATFPVGKDSGDLVNLCNYLFNENELNNPTATDQIT